MQIYLDVLKKYAIFNGRASRKEYWTFVLISTVISILLSYIDYATGVGSATAEFGISGLYSLGVFVPSIAVAVRRMHDVGKEWWYVLIPIYNLILALTRGEEGTNKYGPDPMNPNADEITRHLVE